MAAIGRVGLVSVLAIIIVIAAVGVYAYTDTSQMTTAKTTSSTTASTSSSSITTNMGFTTTAIANSSYPTTLTTTNTSIGLNFTLTLGSSELIGGQAVSITANVTNERSTFNNLTSESDWSEPWLIGWGTIDSCGSFANAQVFQGYYTQSNISSLQPGSELQLAKPLFPPPECPFIPGAWSTYFPFQPHESQVGYQYSASGDYRNASSDSSSSNSTFHLFDSGVYTVASGDEWGQIVILHFLVIPSTESPSSTITTTNVAISCPNNYPNGTDPQDAPVLSLHQNSTGYLCVRFYYYNLNSTMSLNASDVFGIAGYRSLNSSFSNGFDAITNFTISTSPGAITLGGPQNLNEGADVLYAIHANPDSNGTYNYGFHATYYPILETCNGFGPLVVGDGSPNYNVGFGSCTTPLTNPLNSEGFINGVLFVEVVGIMNSSS